jgi:hypothetical protein
MNNWFAPEPQGGYREKDDRQQDPPQPDHQLPPLMETISPPMAITRRGSPALPGISFSQVTSAESAWGKSLRTATHLDVIESLISF